MGPIFDEAKKALRISPSQTAYDSEIYDILEAARKDLRLLGIDASDWDPLIRRAILLYCKAHFGWDNPDSEKLIKSYESLKTHLALAGDYNTF